MSAPHTKTGPVDVEPTETEELDEIGLVDGKYRLDKRLGEGGTGVVYQATHLALQKPFAIKLLRLRHVNDPASFQRFRREAEALGRLHHPHIVEVTDFGVDTAGGRPYLVMEHLEGVTLAEHCARYGPLPLRDALPLLEGIASAVDYAHESGVLHRDLKPGNVLLCRTAGGFHAMVLDFGLAGLLYAPDPDATPLELEVVCEDPELGPDATPSNLTRTGALLGTPRYIAPELFRTPRASRASDIYSFGIMAYEVLVGRPPFDGTAAEVLSAHVEQPPPHPAALGSSLPVELGNALLEPLEKDPGRRPASARDVVASLRRAWRAAETRRWRAVEIPRRRMLAAGITALCLGASLPMQRTGLVQDTERWLADRRFALAPPRSPDPRILLLTMDQISLDNDPLPLTSRSSELGRQLQRVYHAGARGVAIDFLLPLAWSRSLDFSELVLHHADTLTLSAMAGPAGDLIGPECVAGLTAGALEEPERISNLFGLVNIDEDADGVVRRGRLFYKDERGRRLSWAARAAQALGGRPEPAAPSFRIDATVDWRRFERLSWSRLHETLDRTPWIFKDRLVLVGGDLTLSGDDSHRTTGRNGVEPVSGLALQALIVDTILAGLPIHEAPSLPFELALAALGGVAAALALSARRPRRIAVVVVAGAIGYVALAFSWFASTLTMLPVTGPLLTLGGCLGLSLLLRSGLPSAPEWALEEGQ